MCVWIEDADAMQLNDKSLDIVYHNLLTKSFVNNNNSLGIAGIKGQGKTFLLKVKRKKSQLYLDSDYSKILCFPKDNMVDQLDSSLCINPQLITYLQEFPNWVAIWKVAISITILKYKEFAFIRTSLTKKDISDELLSLFEIDNDDCRPSIIFNRLLRLDRKDLVTVLYDTSILLDKLKQINQAIHIFIDKVDQAFSKDLQRIHGNSRLSRNASFWQYSQYSLACAAYEILSANSHIKVYFSIRQEALIDAHIIAGNLKRNINTYIVSLQYSREDLFELFNLYVLKENPTNLVNRHSQKNNQMEAFIGQNSFWHEHINQEEDLMAYIYRHSLKRPYDIIRICRELYYKNDRTIKDIRNTINEVSDDIIRTYLEELKFFIKYDIEDINYLLSNLNFNIFDLKTLQLICEQYSFLGGRANSCSLNCAQCKKLNIFTTLYNIGLIGIIQKNEDGTEYRQEFKSIGGGIINFENIDLPESELYFLHPCLKGITRELRRKKGAIFQTDFTVIVGDGFSITPSAVPEIMKKVRKNYKRYIMDRVFISSTIKDLVDERYAVKDALIKRGYYPVMSESNTFNQNSYELRMKHSHDHCIDEVKKCGCLINIMGKTLGGCYSGTKYKDLENEIIENSMGKITKPSISLMEYYYAIKNNIQTYSFISLEFDRNNCLWEKEKLNEYNFISHLKEEDEVKNNWIIRYANISDLKSRINNLKLNIH